MDIFFKCVVLVCLWQPVHAATIRVDDFEGLKSALAASAPGDLILLEDGDYEISGQFALPVNTEGVTIRGLSGTARNVVISGQGMYGDVSHGFWINAHHVTIEHLTVQSVSNHCIQTDVNVDHLRVSGCIFRDSYEQMLKVPKSDRVPDPSEAGIVEGCVFEYTSGVAPNWYTGGVDVHFGENWIIRGNTFKDIQSPGGGISEHAVHFWSGSSATLVEQNLVVNCDRGIGFGLGDSPHTGGIIRNNMIYHDGSGVFADVGIVIESSSDTRIYNNTVYLNHNRYANAIEFWQTGTTGAYIANNLTNKLISDRGSGTGVVENNITDARISWFAEAAAFDLHLSGMIPEVVDQGIAIDGLADDFDADRRPLRGGIDIGADEYPWPAVNLPIFLLLLQGGE
jgi:hypothetical protein